MPGIPHTTGEGATKSISFTAPPGPRTFLEQLKDEDQVEHMANQLIESMSGLNTIPRICLNELFGWTVQLDPKKNGYLILRI
jgi:hypothetical protein